MYCLQALLFSFACFYVSRKWYHSVYLLQFDFLHNIVFLRFIQVVYVTEFIRFYSYVVFIINYLSFLLLLGFMVLQSLWLYKSCSINNPLGTRACMSEVSLCPDCPGGALLAHVPPEDRKLLSETLCPAFSHSQLPLSIT